jgi:hypothetical protein
MIQSNYNKKIMKMIAAKEREALDNQKQEGHYEQKLYEAHPDNTLTNLTGFEKTYKKQVPIIASGKPKMEMADKVKKSKNVKNLPMVYQDQMTQFKLHGGSSSESEVENENPLEGAPFEGGSGEREELEETSRNFEARALGAGINIKELDNSKKNNEIALQRNLGGSNKSGKLQARAKKVKEVMKEKGLSMIAASKYIKENNISY